MKHVFLETNWVVDYCAPIHYRTPAAEKSVQDADAGAIRLYLPSPCLAEARSAIRVKFQPRQADAIRGYLKWAKANGRVDLEDEERTRRVLDQFEAAVKQDLDGIEGQLDALRGVNGLEIFPLTAPMLERSVSLATEKLDLKPYDNSILAAVLVRAQSLLDAGERDLAFCELDSDLQPWDKHGNTKPALTRLYDDVHVWVYGDFTMTTPEPRQGW